MSNGANAALRLSTASIGPLLVLMSLMISLGGETAGAGLAGLAAALAYFLHIVVYGADSAARAAPPLALRALSACGVLFVGVCLTANFFEVVAPRAVLNFGVWCAVCGSSALAIAAIAARTHALSDETW